MLGKVEKALMVSASVRDFAFLARFSVFSRNPTNFSVHDEQYTLPSFSLGKKSVFGADRCTHQRPASLSEDDFLKLL